MLDSNFKSAACNLLIFVLVHVHISASCFKIDK